MNRLITNSFYFLFSLVLVFFYLIIKKKKKKIIWMPEPLINNKYWSNALKDIGYESETLMKSFYNINNKNDFDIYFDDLVPKYLKKIPLRRLLPKLFSFIYVLSNASVVNLPFSGGVFDDTILWKLEVYLYKKAGIKILVVPYGGDAYLYSQVIDPCWRHALLINYPQNAKNEENIRKKVFYWHKNADIFIAGIMIDGMGRWDVSPCQPLVINTNNWQKKDKYNDFDASSKEKIVKILHTPNHRGAKGTEYLIDAVEKLKKEGLHIELILLEKIPNEKVKEYMQEVDILAEQFIATAYALSGIEGMASGLPVMSNLKNETYTRLLRRYSYLNECPILSTQPEIIMDNLRVLIKNPKLREELGKYGREYVEKYHSYETAQYVFGSIYEKILRNKDIDLMNLFHPLKSEYNKKKPFVLHPLFENNLQKKYTYNV